MNQGADLFAAPADPGLEFIQAPGRTYRLHPASIGGQARVTVSWIEANRQGVLGGYHADDGAALAAIEHAETNRTRGE